MEIFNINNDTRVFYVTATSFPEGVKQSFQILHSKLPTTQSRNFFGISYLGKDGKIIYKAAVEESYEGEAEKLGCETFIIRKGNYVSEFIPDFMDDIQKIGRVFKELLAYPGIDPKGYCLEIYTSQTDVRCMVPLS